MHMFNIIQVYPGIIFPGWRSPLPLLYQLWRPWSLVQWPNCMEFGVGWNCEEIFVSNRSEVLPESFSEKNILKQFEAKTFWLNCSGSCSFHQVSANNCHSTASAMKPWKWPTGTSRPSLRSLQNLKLKSHFFGAYSFNASITSTYNYITSSFICMPSTISLG